MPSFVALVEVDKPPVGLFTVMIIVKVGLPTGVMPVHEAVSFFQVVLAFVCANVKVGDVEA